MKFSITKKHILIIVFFILFTLFLQVLLGPATLPKIESDFSNKPSSIINYHVNNMDMSIFRSRDKGVNTQLFYHFHGKPLSFIFVSMLIIAYAIYKLVLFINYRELIRLSIMTYTNGNNFK